MSLVSLGSRLGRASRSAAASLVLLALIASAVPPPHHADPHHAEHADEHGTPSPSAPALVRAAPQHAGLEVLAIWAWIDAAWSALRGGREICQDCSRQAGEAHLPVDRGCQCMCYSGGEACPGPRPGDPFDPSC